MSASLVGSEMCIRDRTSTSTAASRRGARCVRLARQRASPGLGDPGEAVSYTHLTLPTICSV
eukprot:7965270-Alexandrium_andersonii.AAC.1